MARYDIDPATQLGDIAFVVRDSWQRRGVGSCLMRRMTQAARANGLPTEYVDELASTPVADDQG